MRRRFPRRDDRIDGYRVEQYAEMQTGMLGDVIGESSLAAESNSDRFCGEELREEKTRSKMATNTLNVGTHSDPTAVIKRQEFGANQISRTAETAVAAVQAREAARINAMHIMAERHPRNWDTVRVRLLAHCDRPGFAECAWYKKPAGKKVINGQYKQAFAEGLSARFAEVARQEMGNTNTETSITYEDDLVRIIRASVTDLERNSIESRELTIAKAVERKGKKKPDGQWDPPEGRDVISERINSYGEPAYLVRATEDEIRIKQNSEISKTTRDASLRLIPKDIRDDCESRIAETRNDPKKTDPAAARKRIIDSFAQLGVLPDDLVTYVGCPLDRISPAQLDELRGLWTAINDGEITFAEAMRERYDQPKDGTAETAQQRDLRLQRQMEEQAAAQRKPQQQDAPAERGFTDEENRKLDAELAAQERAEAEQQPARPRLNLRRSPQ